MIIIKIIGYIILFFLLIGLLREVLDDLKYAAEQREERERKDFFEVFFGLFCLMTTRQMIPELTEQEKHILESKFALIVNSLGSGTFNYNHRRKVVNYYLKLNHRSRVLYGVDFIDLGKEEMMKIIKREKNRNFCRILGVVAILISLVYDSLLIGAIISFFFLIDTLMRARDNFKDKAKINDFFELLCIVTTGKRISEFSEWEKHFLESKFALMVNSIKAEHAVFPEVIVSARCSKSEILNYNRRKEVVNYYLKLNYRCRILHDIDFINLSVSDMYEFIRGEEERTLGWFWAGLLLLVITVFTVIGFQK